MLTAMTELCAERGAANISVTQVVGRSGVSRRTFYELFKDREECLLVAFDEAVKCGSERVLPAYAAERHWTGQMRAGLTALLQFLDDEPQMGRLLVIQALAAGPKALERRQRVLDALAQAVDSGRADPKRKGSSQMSGSLSPLTAQGVVGAVFSVIHTHMLGCDRGPLLDLSNGLASMIVMPYLGTAAARRELARPAPRPRSIEHPSATSDPLRNLEMRLTYRTVRVLLAIAAHPRASNRQIAQAAEVSDQGQISKLLARLRHLGLIDNAGLGGARGEPNAWVLTHRGHEVEQTLLV
jgi:AcrR family transcriptional regulator